MAAEWTSGSWLPKIKTLMGVIPVDASVSNYEIEPVISSTSPALLNPAGGDNLVITGTGFPASLNTQDSVLAYFSDTTSCTIVSMTSTEITCQTDPFVTARRRRFRNLGAFDFSLVINGKSTTTTTTVEDGVPTVESITPSSVSPIAFTTLEIKLSDDYPADTMDADTFSVNLILRELG